MKKFILLSILCFSISSFCSEDKPTTGGGGGPQKLNVETIDLSTILPGLKPKDKVKTINVFDLTNNEFTVRTQKPVTLSAANKEVKTFDDLLERVNKMGSTAPSQLKPMQLLVPVKGIQGMRIDGQYFNREEFVGAEQLLIDQTHDYEVFFNNGEVIDLEALPTLSK